MDHPVQSNQTSSNKKLPLTYLHTYILVKKNKIYIWIYPYLGLNLMHPNAATHHGRWLQWWMLLVSGISGGWLWWMVAVGVR